MAPGHGDDFAVTAIRSDGGEAVLARRVRVAATFAARLRGLIGRRLAEGEGLLLRRCRAIHTCFMSFPIDVVFLDQEGRVLATARDLPPWRFRAARDAAMVLELPAGTLARAAVGPGARLVLTAWTLLR